MVNTIIPTSKGQTPCEEWQNVMPQFSWLLKQGNSPADSSKPFTTVRALLFIFFRCIQTISIQELGARL